MSTGTEYKNQGNQKFKAGDYGGAIELYTKAVNMEPDNHVFYSNRCAAYTSWGKFTEAEADARQCIQKNKSWAKGYFRLATALEKQSKFIECLKVLKDGLRVESNHKDLMRMVTTIEPQAKAEEARKRSGMSREEQLKAEGNDCFKASQFDTAIAKYTQALQLCSDKSSKLALACYGNRAACHQQQSNFSAVVEDCSHVLEHDQNNQKALLRRALSFEGLERYRSALADVRQLLLLCPTNAIANKAQHRLAQNVRRLKKTKEGGF